MKRSYRFYMSILLLGAFLLSACSGAMPRQDNSAAPGSPDSQVTEVVFTGSVQSMGGGDWTISGQSVGVSGSTSIDANIQVGDIVTVEAQVSQDGKVIALKIEASLPDDTGANANDSNSNAGNANSDDNTYTGNDNGNANGNDDNANTNANGNDNSAPAGPEQEILGAVQAMTSDSITIGGVTYKLAQFTEFKNPIVVGDQVKIHVIVNADGTLTIREIEKTTGTGLTTNQNGNSNDDNGNASNSNDDNGGGSNSNDDNGGGSNSNDDNGGGSNSNDDNGGGGNGNG